MPTIEIDGAELHYEDAGSGRPVVFLHGVWMSSRFFAGPLLYFAGAHRAIALDFRGHGRSAKPQSGHTLSQYARDVRGFLEALDLSEVVLVGWSMGFLVVLEYVRQFGVDRLAAVVDIDQSPSDYRWPDWPHGFLDFDSLCHVMEAVQTDREALVRGFIPSMFKDEPADDDVAWMVEEITRVPESVAGAIIFDQTVQDYRPELTSITVPALVCTGRSEGLVPVAAAELAAERMPAGRLVVFEESDHCPFLEEPELFNAEVDAFLRALA